MIKLLTEQERKQKFMALLREYERKAISANNFFANVDSQLVQSQKKAHADMVIGEQPCPYINGRFPERGETIQIYLERNQVESLTFVQDNGAYMLWTEQRERNK